MDRLKHSLEDREAPTCPTCGIEMQWYRSELVRFVPITNLHLFNCPTCFLLAESETVNEPVWVSPNKPRGSRFPIFCPAGIGAAAAAGRRAHSHSKDGGKVLQPSSLAMGRRE